MTLKHPLVQMIDAAVEADAKKEAPFRAHLGGSMIGRKCERALWYSFRWAAVGTHSGRMLRLFARGHLEEFRFVQYLQRIGMEIRAYSERLMYHVESDSYTTIPWDPDTSHEQGGIEEVLAVCVDVTTSQLHVARAEGVGVRLKQWRISDVMGHFGGSLDGEATNIPGEHPETKGLLEFKTHNTKSFCKLITEGVQICKPEHYAQMQIYMHKRGLLFAIYVAVNKNDDDLHIEVVHYDEAMALQLLEKAERVITSDRVPDRLPGAGPSFWDCKWCDYLKQCHYGEPMHKSCRSCVHSKPVDGGEWMCKKWSSIIPVEVISTGCDDHKQITD